MRTPLDVSIRAQVAEQRERDGPAYPFISHGPTVVRRVAHRVGVMQAGRLVELRPTGELFDDPRHEFTRTLLGAIAGRRHAPDPGVPR